MELDDDGYNYGVGSKRLGINSNRLDLFKNRYYKVKTLKDRKQNVLKELSEFDQVLLKSEKKTIQKILDDALLRNRDNIYGESEITRYEREKTVNELLKKD